MRQGGNGMASVRLGIHRLRNAHRQYLARFTRDEEGVTMLEFTILISFITVVVILSVVYAGSWAGSKWTILTSALNGVGHQDHHDHH